MLFLTLKQAENALAGGRLDEAFELIRSNEVRDHYRGRQLTDLLVRALVDRGRVHLADERFAQALADCTRAEQLGGNLASVAELRADLNRAVEKKQLADRQQGLALARARELIDQGHLSMGEQFLSELAADGRAEILRGEVSARRKIVEASLQRAQTALDRQDAVRAVAELLRVKQNHAQNPRYHEMTAEVIALVDRQVRRAFQQGRIDQAQTALTPLLPLAEEGGRVRELQRMLEQCRQASQSIRNGQFSQSLLVLRQLRTALPEATWLTEAIKTLETLADALETLQAGPLGMLEPDSNAAEVRKMEKSVPPGKIAVSPLPLPPKFVIQVDGVGSFLVVRDSRVSVGPISSPQRPQIGLVADPNLPVMTIERLDDDYFIRTDSGEQKLLSDNDHLALGPRCRLKFRLPNAASTTAVLQLSGARLPQGDIRQIVLMNRELVIGPGPAAHIRCDELSEQVILHVQNGGLRCRTNLPLPFDEIPTGTPVQIGPLSFTITGDQLQGSI